MQWGASKLSNKRLGMYQLSQKSPITYEPNEVHKLQNVGGTLKLFLRLKLLLACDLFRLPVAVLDQF